MILHRGLVIRPRMPDGRLSSTVVALLQPHELWWKCIALASLSDRYQPGDYDLSIHADDLRAGVVVDPAVLLEATQPIPYGTGHYTLDPSPTPPVAPTLLDQTLSDHVRAANKALQPKGVIG